MYSLAYVILPFSNAPPAEAITASLARFQIGRRGDIPSDWLRFHDRTAQVKRMHRTTFTFHNGTGLRVEGGESWYLDTTSVRREMARRGLEQWTVRFADIEPDLHCFAERFLRPFDRHPVTHGLGNWLNPLGRWDWWELGGRFDGVITGESRSSVRTRGSITSRPSAGRAMLENIEDAVDSALGQKAREPIDIQADANIELVATLRTNVDCDGNQRRPGAIVLPPHAVGDHARWLHSWPDIGPTEGLEYLDLSPTSTWHKIIEAAYDRFPNHWAAAIAFHH